MNTSLNLAPPNVAAVVAVDVSAARASATLDANEPGDREAQAPRLCSGGIGRGDATFVTMFRQIAVDEDTPDDAYKAALARLPRR